MRTVPVRLRFNAAALLASASAATSTAVALSEFLSDAGQRVTRLPAVEKLEAKLRLQGIDTAGGRALTDAQFARGGQRGAAFATAGKWHRSFQSIINPFCNFAESERNLGV